MKIYKLNFGDYAKCNICKRTISYKNGWCTLDFLYFCSKHIPKRGKVEYPKIKRKKK